MLHIFSSDYNLTTGGSAEFIYLENSLRVDTKIRSSRWGDVIGARISGRGEKNLRLLTSRVTLCFFYKGFRRVADRLRYRYEK